MSGTWARGLAWLALSLWLHVLNSGVENPITQNTRSSIVAGVTLFFGWDPCVFKYKGISLEVLLF